MLEGRLAAHNAEIDCDPAEPFTHEQYLHGIRDRVLEFARINAESSNKIIRAKLVYGLGTNPAMRGQCLHGVWHSDNAHAMVEICALAEESPMQLAGTELHEFGHVLAGYDAGHGRAWKDACRSVGLIRATAKSQIYDITDFCPEIQDYLLRTPAPSDGKPVTRVQGDTAPATVIAKPSGCPLGIGTRGGKSRGKGAESRLRFFMCQCPEKPYRVRIGRDVFDVTCNLCGSKFERVFATETRAKKRIH